MSSKGIGFASYSRTLCWIVAVIWLAMAILSFTGDSGNSVINGFLWLAGAVAFAVSGAMLGKNSNTAAGDDQAG